MVAVPAIALLGLAAQSAQAAPAPLDSGQLSNKLALIIEGCADRGARTNELADPASITGADNIAGLYSLLKLIEAV